MSQVIEILRAAGEDTRLRIIALLAKGELAAQEISNVLGQSQPRVSRHLRLLNEAGIIEKRPEGAWVFARLSKEPLVNSIIEPILKAISPNDRILLADIAHLAKIRATRDEHARAYFDSIASEWEVLKKIQQPDKAVKEAFLSLLGNEKFKFHLDLGSGMGDMLEFLAPLATHSEGVDNSRGMISYARSRLDGANNGNIIIRMGDINDLPYKDGEIDLITIHQVLHYLHEPKAAIFEAARVLSNLGTLLIADFAPHNVEELRKNYGHQRLGFSMEEICDWCTQSGLELCSKVTIKSDEVENNNYEFDEHFRPLAINVYKFKNKKRGMQLDSPIENKDFA